MPLPLKKQISFSVSPPLRKEEVNYLLSLVLADTTKDDDGTTMRRCHVTLPEDPRRAQELMRKLSEFFSARRETRTLTVRLQSGGNMLQHKLGPFFSTHLPEFLESLTLHVNFQHMRAKAFKENPKSSFLFVLPNLKDIRLSDCSVDDAVLEAIGLILGQRLPKLESLDLSHNRIQKSRHIADVVGHALCKLDLSVNPITSSGASWLFDAFENNSTLQLVNLHQTRITRQDLEFEKLMLWKASQGFLFLSPFEGCLRLRNLVALGNRHGCDIQLHFIEE